MPFAINITEPHQLCQEEAFTRVLKWLKSENKPDPHVAVLKTTIENAAGTIQILLSAYGYPVTIDIAVTSDHVNLKTNEAADIVEGLAMRWKAGDVQKQLAEVLK